MSAEEVANAFTTHWYNGKDTNPAGLAALFQPGSMMTFEGAQFLGPQNIIEKLQGLGQVKHEPKNRDVQPGVAPNTILIQVSGTVNIGGPNPVAFIETIQLNATAPGQYYVHNTMFRLMYAL